MGEKNNREMCIVEEFEECPDEPGSWSLLLTWSLSQATEVCVRPLERTLRVVPHVPEKCVGHCGCCPEMIVYVGHSLSEATLLWLMNDMSPCEGLLGHTEVTRDAVKHLIK